MEQRVLFWICLTEFDIRAAGAVGCLDNGNRKMVHWQTREVRATGRLPHHVAACAMRWIPSATAADKSIRTIRLLASQASFLQAHRWSDWPGQQSLREPEAGVEPGVWDCQAGWRRPPMDGELQGAAQRSHSVLGCVNADRSSSIHWSCRTLALALALVLALVAQ